MNARDRIGSGPWFNQKGVQIAGSVDELHYSNAALTKETQLDENGDINNGRGDDPNRHDILTGSQLDGMRFTDEERGGPRNSDRLLRWDPDQGEGVWHATEETELSC